MRTVWLLVLIGFNVFWAGTYSVFKDLGAWLTPGQLVTLRFGMAALVLLPLWPWLKGPAPRGALLARTALMGILVFVCAPRLQVVASRLGQAGDMSVLVALEPLVTTLGAALFLREKVPPQRWLGFAFGMGGVVLLARVWAPGFHFASLGASLIFISSFFCESAYSVMGKPLIERFNLVKVITLALLAGVAVNLALDGPSTVTAAQHLPLRAWLQVAYLAVLCTAVGYAVWFGAMRVLAVNAVVMTLFMQPFAGMLIALGWLGEQPHWGQLWGGLAIATGLALGLREERR